MLIPENDSCGAVAPARSQKQAPPCDVRTVLRALGPHDAARALVLADFRARGVSPDTWHLRPTREAMAEALSRAEDALEVESRGRVTVARVELRGIRRRVERELWS
jgi:hypothetical protein